MTICPLFNRIITLIPLVLLAVGCEYKVAEPPKPEFTDQNAEVLCGISNDIIIPMATDLTTMATYLEIAIQHLNQQRTSINLEWARQAWRDARVPWEMSEAAMFGPAKNQQIDPSIDSWPVDKISLEAMLMSNEPLTSQYIDQSIGSVKGFSAIEYVLWGENENKQVRQITEREYQFLVAATTSLRAQTERFRQSWLPASAEGGNYGWQICNAGRPNSLYLTQRAGLQELLNGIVGILAELREAKMGIPFSLMDSSFEESDFSNNSLADFQNNVLGVRSIYLGEYGDSRAEALTHLVQAKNPQLDADIREQLQMAVNLLGSIKPSFSAAIARGGDRSSVNAAMTAIGILRVSFEDRVLPLLAPTH